MHRFIALVRLHALVLGACAAALTLAPQAGRAQLITPSGRPVAPCVVVPQARVYTPHHPGTVSITSVVARVNILEQVATTTLDVHLENSTSQQLEAELLVPVPEDAVVKGFSFEGPAREPTAVVLRKEEARRLYDEVVARFRDPALLEFAGYNLVRSSLFPVPPAGAQRLRLVYEHLLPADGNRVDYVLPRSESLEHSVAWKLSMRIQAKKAISTVYSPSHAISTVRVSDDTVTLDAGDKAAMEPGAFRLSYLLADKGVTASLFAYPDPRSGGGYFLLLAGLPAKPEADRPGQRIRREIILVIDRSGSMTGEKIEQVREAALQILGGLDEGEAFNIIAYNSTVEFFAPEPVLKTPESERMAREYLRSLKVGSGTNLHDALVEALRQRHNAGMLPLVLFLTDGLPTVGQTSEAAIRDVALKANPHNRRVFTFGVGFDVNTALLEKVAYETRAMATFVLPKENVEVKVGSVFQRLAGPILADPRLEVLGPDGTAQPYRVRDVIPARLPDLFTGDQLIVLGRYVGEAPLAFSVRGNYLGMEKSFQFSFGLEKATTRNGFVPRLWASRQIGLLVDAIRQLGADGGPLPPAQVAEKDPRLKELVDEVIRLSTEFGILTEYTAFLAREGTDLTRKELVIHQAAENFKSRALNVRSGQASLNQDLNNRFSKEQTYANSANAYFDEKLDCIKITNVQQVNDCAFYCRSNRWVDSRIVDKETQPRRVVRFGSPDYGALLAKLVSQGRQGCISLRGDVLMVVDGEAVLIEGPKPEVTVGK
jgi:Ca-activated chloride channel family protein